eukprot:CAMPEP_0198114680 /NCGR_PEP_ID=MMETSP1442-20131203/5997_1 /TAXON_ID= /ORGANISM="Craspedostauros australis, Strain CCMP3328" /LENGTH=376 /DNA_ID=CAMNT_0043772049 /DNA_START=305 /DNA_END=1435 /DNA_ORIENTATION=+
MGCVRVRPLRLGKDIASQRRWMHALGGSRSPMALLAQPLHAPSTYDQGRRSVDLHRSQRSNLYSYSYSSGVILAKTKDPKDDNENLHSSMQSEIRLQHTQHDGQQIQKIDERTSADSTAADGDGETLASSDEVAENTTSTLWDQLRSPPNIITLTRMATTPLLAMWVINEQHSLALMGCLVAGASDYLDGYLAKNHGMSTVLGSYLDPMADKVVINALAISLWHIGTLPTALVGLWAIKDFTLLSFGAIYLRKATGSMNIFRNATLSEPLTVQPNTIAKINTALQFATLGMGILEPTLLGGPWMIQFNPDANYSALECLCWMTGGTSVATIVSYIGSAGFSEVATPNSFSASDDGDSKKTITPRSNTSKGVDVHQK